jgi:hypothetical protein
MTVTKAVNPTALSGLNYNFAVYIAFKQIVALPKN